MVWLCPIHLFICLLFHTFLGLYHVQGRKERDAQSQGRASLRDRAILRFEFRALHLQCKWSIT
jgi:hypothetical protein